MTSRAENAGQTGVCDIRNFSNEPSGIVRREVSEPTRQGQLQDGRTQQTGWPEFDPWVRCPQKDDVQAHVRADKWRRHVRIPVVSNTDITSP
jgi:hypothetical protein